jgi:hypothetical protein
MGWHYILQFKCKVLPEFREFVEKQYLCKFSEVIVDEWDRKTSKSEREELEREFEALPKSTQDVLNAWNCLNIGRRFYEYEFVDNVFSAQISKRVRDHSSSSALQEDYLTFMKDVIVPISSEITWCTIESDDVWLFTQHYTDSELRNIGFNLKDKIKCIEHTYNEDGSEIYETRVVYKHSIKKLQFMDLQRAYSQY